METLGIACIGLVLGALGFVVVIGALRLQQPPAPLGVEPAASATDGAPSTRPAWLETAEPPRARIGSGPSSAPPEERARPASEAKAETSRPGRVEVSAIDYTTNPSQRAVT